jgi:hypothetical protein
VQATSVKAGVGELEDLGIAKSEVSWARELFSASLPDLQHLRTELNPNQLDVRGIERQVSRRAAGKLEHLAAGMGAEPLATAAEQSPLKEADLAIVASRLLVLDAPDTLGPAAQFIALGSIRLLSWPFPSLATLVDDPARRLAIRATIVRSAADAKPRFTARVETPQRHRLARRGVTHLALGRAWRFG